MSYEALQPTEEQNQKPVTPEWKTTVIQDAGQPVTVLFPASGESIPMVSVEHSQA